MSFLRVVEVFPPLVPDPATAAADWRPESWAKACSPLKEVADVVLVADLALPRRMFLSPVEAAARLKGHGFRAFPTLVVRDMNSAGFQTALRSCAALGLDGVMVAWGDDYPAGSGVTNVRDYHTLAEAVKVARSVLDESTGGSMLLAPVSLEKDPGAMSRGKERLEAGADYLLAQPPTTDALGTFDSHLELLEGAGLSGKVLLGVFPFRDDDDLAECESKFEWDLPERVHSIAQSGVEALDAECKSVVERLREEEMPGVYLSTRGDPTWAQRLLL